jgi:SNF2 family DNA or RNA helicase
MLAMAMGTGKSRAAIELAQHFEQGAALIVCPLRVIEVWRGQFQKFAPDWGFLPLDDRFPSVREKTLAARNALERPRFEQTAIAINFDSARVEPFASWALARVWPLAILDESHRIKAPGGRTSLFAARLGRVSRHRLALTGTPMAHEPTDIWAQFRFLDPTLLDHAFSSYRARYAVMGGYFHKEVVGWRDLDKLEADFRQLAFRVDDSVLDLPPEMDQELACELGEEGARCYREMEREMIAWVRAGENVTAANAMVKLLRLQQITGGALPDPQGEGSLQIDDAKERLLADLLEDLREPVVVFARFHADLRAIYRAALRAGIPCAELSGQRDDLARWKESEGPSVLAVQIQAGGVGVDLTKARVAVFYSLGFSLSDYLQARARIRRPPQARPCVFYHLKIRDSVDEYVMRAVLARQDLVDGVLNELKARKGDSHGVEPLAS